MSASEYLVRRWMPLPSRKKTEVALLKEDLMEAVLGPG